jgi:hypothetical protein
MQLFVPAEDKRVRVILTGNSEAFGLKFGCLRDRLQVTPGIVDGYRNWARAHKAFGIFISFVARSKRH